MNLQTGPGLKSILAVVVLYKTPAEQSSSFLSLRQQLAHNPQAAAAFDLIVCDNTPTEQPAPVGFDDLYIRFNDNPGLARCYNLALKIAQERGIPWLLLLDQDTTLTAEFIEELVTAAPLYQAQAEVVALVPKLAQKGVVVSPHFPPFIGPAVSVPADAEGLWPGFLYVFNSGSTLRVAAVQAIGGFPLDYPLDFLDHATYSALQQRGGRLAVLRSILAHDLSTSDTGTYVPELVPRLIGILDAEFRYYNQFGSPKDRMLRRLRLLRAVAGRAAHNKNWDHTRRLFRAAFRV